MDQEAVPRGPSARDRRDDYDATIDVGRARRRADVLPRPRPGPVAPRPRARPGHPSPSRGRARGRGRLARPRQSRPWTDREVANTGGHGRGPGRSDRGPGAVAARACHLAPPCDRGDGAQPSSHAVRSGPRRGGAPPDPGGEVRPRRRRRGGSLAGLRAARRSSRPAGRPAATAAQRLLAGTALGVAALRLAGRSGPAGLAIGALGVGLIAAYPAGGRTRRGRRTPRTARPAIATGAPVGDVMIPIRPPRLQEPDLGL